MLYMSMACVTLFINAVWMNKHWKHEDLRILEEMIVGDTLPR
jgi:hypothetical protein